MKLSVALLALLTAGALPAVPCAASPRLEIGPLTRTLALPGLRACYAARLPGSIGPGLRFLTTGSSVLSVDSTGGIWPLLSRANLLATVSDPVAGILLCTSRGVYATRDGRNLRWISSMVFTHVTAEPVGGLFARPDVGLFGFDGREFQLIRAVPWHSIDSMAIAPGGAIWFVGAYYREDGTLSPQRLYVARDRSGQTVIEDSLSPDETASAVTEYFGRILATVDGVLQGTADDGQSWTTFDEFGRSDLTLTTLPLYENQPWQGLWIGVRGSEGGPAPLWYDDYASGLQAQPINAAHVSQVTADLSRNLILFVADEALFEAPYQVQDDAAASPPWM
jgi:hypothetical protein